MPRPFDVAAASAALVAILLLSCNGGGGDWGADAECANCERRINEWCCETGWRGSCCEFPLQGGLSDRVATQPISKALYWVKSTALDELTNSLSFSESKSTLDFVRLGQ